MAEEQANSNVQEPTPDPNQNSVEATIESGVDFGATESTCNNNNNDSNNNESSVVTSDAEFQKSLEYADELMVRGSKASQDRDYAEATDYYSRALEIRLGFFLRYAFVIFNLLLAIWKWNCFVCFSVKYFSKLVLEIEGKVGT